MDAKELTGSVKAAILIQSMGPEASQKIFNHLSDNEKVLINSILAQMGPISQDLVEKVAEEFAGMAVQKGLSTAKTGVWTERGQEESDNSKDSASRLRNLDALQSLDPDHLVGLIRDEHPQTIAIIIVHLKPEMASEVLSKLPDQIKADVALRIANLDKVISGMVDEIDKVFEEVLKSKKVSVTHKTGGPAHLAEILNQIDGTAAQTILDEIEENNPELVSEIKQKMFVFEDLLLVDDKGLQKLLRSIETAELAMALKAASEEVREKILRNMSERAGEMLGEEIEALGAVRMKEVEDAQQNITKLIQDMEAKGEIVISGRKGEEFVG